MSCDEMVILKLDFNNINFHDVNFDEDDPETIIQVRLRDWPNKQKFKASSRASYKIVRLVHIKR